MKPITTVLLLLLAFSCEAKRLNSERHYQTLICARPALMEVTYYSPEGNPVGRVDCLTEHYAIEVDFADKWAEGIGQAYLYAAVFERRPGVVYIIEDANDCKHYEKVMVLLETLPQQLSVWLTGPAKSACGAYTGELL